MCSHVLLLLIFAATALGQTVELSDRNHIPVAEISDIRMFRYSEYFQKDIPDFQATARNVSGQNLRSFSVKATAYKKDGSRAGFTFSVGACDECPFFFKDSTLTVRHAFLSPFPYTAEDFERVLFAISPWWQSPEDERIAAEVRAKKEAAEKARRNRLEAEQSKKAAEARARTRVACAVVYRSTANKKVGDLTVKEEQEVRSCQVLGLYPPY